MRSSRGTAIAVVALLGALALVGCDEEPEPGPDTQSSSTPSEPSTSPVTTPSPSEPIEPTLPAAAEEETKAGAEAFVEYYWQVVNYAQATGEVALLGSLSIPGCDGCNGGIEGIEKVYERGGRMIGGVHRVVRIESIRTPSGSWAVDTQVRISRQMIKGAGDLNQTSRPGVLELLFGLNFQDGGWVVTSLDAD